MEVLAQCHLKGVMHRNIKPENILLDDENNVILCDFSMSRLIDSKNIDFTPEDPKERDRSGREARRLWYRAPELLLRKSKYTQEVDMWSVGCLLAELAINSVLFDGESEVEQLFKILTLTGSYSEDTIKLIGQGEATEFKSTPMPKWERIDFVNLITSRKYF
jgi:cyclin-dependent kinase